MTIPVHTNRAHFEPPYTGDNLEALAIAKHRGYDYIDQNANMTSDGVVVIKHWRIIRKDGFTWIHTGKYTNKGREIRVPWTTKTGRPHGRNQRLDQTPWDVVRRLRRQPFPWLPGGKERYHTFAEHVAQAHKVGITICLELKDDIRFGTSYAVAKRMSLTCKKMHATVYIMTLQNTRDPWAALSLFHSVGFGTAILPRGPRPATWTNNQARYVDRVWGHWS